MNAIEAAVYAWLRARKRALKAKCSFNKKGEAESTDPEAWTELGLAEIALQKTGREWLGMEAGFGVGPKFEASKAPSLPQEPAIEQ